MKKILAFFLLVFFWSVMTIACDINIVSDRNSYKVGDTAIITIRLIQDHSKCLHEGEEPLINYVGVKPLAKTSFTQQADGSWVIKYKVEITAQEASFTAFRNCTKGGGIGSFTFNIE